jgi:hypothetical protein
MSEGAYLIKENPRVREFQNAKGYLIMRYEKNVGTRSLSGISAMKFKGVYVDAESFSKNVNLVKLIGHLRKKGIEILVD